jgi:hypothetical protein
VHDARPPVRIAAHARQQAGRKRLDSDRKPARVDVFSCRAFDPHAAAAIAVQHFGGQASVRVLER